MQQLDIKLPGQHIPIRLLYELGGTSPGTQDAQQQVSQNGLVLQTARTAHNKLGIKLERQELGPLLPSLLSFPFFTLPEPGYPAQKSLPSCRQPVFFHIEYLWGWYLVFTSN
jgi:hypothetical protein